MQDEGTIGVVDLGTEEQKAKLYRIEELIPAAGEPVALGPTDPSKWTVYPRRDQDGSSSCVFQARAKAAGILREQTTGEFVVYSAADYRKRSNAPAEGAYPVEAFEFWRKHGIGLEVLEPSQFISEAEFNTDTQDKFDEDVARISSIDNYVALPAYNFDVFLATLKATNKPIPVGFFATSREWKRDVPALLDPSLSLVKATVRHEVCATPNYGVYEGNEGFTIEDSWGDTGIEGKGVRWITREFFNRRNYLPGLYPTKFKTYADIGVVTPAKPRVSLPYDLEFGMEDTKVKELQEVLKFEGFFPANHPGSIYYHNITRDGVQKFQVKHGIAAPTNAGYGRCGPKTRAKINSLYA